MNNERKGKNIVIGLLCATIVFMGIGFAALSSVLNINGSATINGTWNVQITDIRVANTTGKANAGTPTHTASSATFDAQLSEPGDSVTYEVTVTNGGSINAVLNSATPTLNVKNAEYDAIVYTLSESNPANGAKLASNGTHTFTVTATYNTKAVDDHAPSDSDMTKQFTLVLNYGQDLTA